LDPLGAGSDYTVFVHHLGVASLDLGFGGENDGGSYHSIYDSFDHYTRFGDPTFDYGVALTKVTGRAILRFANSEVLPFEFSGMADAVERFTNQVIRLADEKRAEVEEKNRRVLEKTLEAYFDPTLPFVLPKSQPVVPFLNFAPLQNALSRLKEGSSKLEQLLQRIPSDNDRLSGKGRSQANQLLAQAERALTAKEGLPRRPWFKHEVYAPGFYTGYQVKTLPGIREALEQQNWHEAEEQIRQAADTLDQFTYLLNDLNSMISSPKISSQSSPDSWSSAH
jgi:N-acetylated-alpha-linked acidic dipeptidase